MVTAIPDTAPTTPTRPRERRIVVAETLGYCWGVRRAVDIITEAFVIRDGRLDVPQEPGLGVLPDLDALERFRSSKVIGAYLDPDRPGWFAEKPKY